ncbi:dephospho-CoA kinase [Paenibacillus chitinolyticus]|uniref:Dephospho-CoA kinase n=1 Tax=Paenibacillus chitinolyticus TaxID=79263 RepID=A0A410WTS0_9BACL|nr:dephospho-CoA kinase [Paenibacillus chitinolyticus]MCY9591959.1 dephospho-CoA kinase [Paenibacillus chitinolyticus]MCY9595016.1 dephospho-CoA kinase [Paenibacillus chitinolyticus]QAV17886.1 dephospho-CoA kinase [Paenibacillus chitinolyticus]
MNIGLTGGIACGKSTVSAMLVRRGAILIDADRIAREVVEPGSPVLAQVAAHFGQDMLLPDGSLHRKKLGKTVFGNEEARKALEDLLHPSIRALMKERMAAAEREFPDKLVVVDVPLLYESGLQSMFSSVMVVYVPREVQLRRLMERDGLNAEQAESRLAAQWPIERKKELADSCIDNSGTLEQTEQFVERFWLQRGL